ncbi:DUF6042 family protein [Nonomuraea recticatena]|uniref:Uncharacterized protein n=1 Tax=Nonomuraea recticatena TaxID=46178 RepID=A0ABN3SBF6_9ACTN
MRTVAVENYWPEYGTIVIRDAPGVDPASRPLRGVPLLGEHDMDAQPGGTIARAGDAWLQAVARDGRHRVRLEAHDAPLPLDDGWDDVVETPYHANTGSVMLTTVLHSEVYSDRPLRLGPPGLYRVRVSCRRTPPEIPGLEASKGDLWRMQFWATSGSHEPPLWLSRSHPAVPPPLTRWETSLGLPSQEVLHAVRVAAAAGDATEEQIAAAYHPWSSSSGDWGAPLSDTLSEFAVQLGVPAPTTRLELLPFLVAAGLVVAWTSGGATRYQLSTKPPRADEVVRLSAEQAAALRRQDAFHRYTRLAADLAAVAVWSPGQTVSETMEELAERLLAPAAEIGQALGYGVERGLLSVRGKDAFTAVPRPPLQTEPGSNVREAMRLRGEEAR